MTMIVAAGLPASGTRSSVPTSSAAPSRSRPRAARPRLLRRLLRRLLTHRDLLLSGACFLAACAAVALPVIGRASAPPALSAPQPRRPTHEAVGPEIKDALRPSASVASPPAPPSVAPAAERSRGEGSAAALDALDAVDRPRGAARLASLPLRPSWSAALVQADAGPEDAGPPDSAARSEAAPSLVGPAENGPRAPQARSSAERAWQGAEPFVGVWGARPDACSLRRGGSGDLLAAIDRGGAWAGETRCAFRNRRATARGWRVEAACANAGDHWTSTVHLRVAGARLTWTSQRGTTTYVRCGQRLRTASAAAL